MVIGLLSIVNTAEAQEGTHTYLHEDGLEFSTNDNGIISIEKDGELIGRLCNAITGTWESVNYTFTCKDFDWEWSKSNYTDIIEDFNETTNQSFNATYNVQVLTAYNTFAAFNWTKQIIFHPLYPMKMKHMITNDLGSPITNIKFWYVIQINKENLLGFGESKIIFQDYEFRYHDIIADGFIITDKYKGIGGFLDHPNKYIAAVGITKGAGILPDEFTIELDPEVSAFKTPDETGVPEDDWANGDNIKVSDDIDTTTSTVGDNLSTSNYTFFVDTPPITLHGIEIELEGLPCSPCVIGERVTVGIRLSWDGGTSFTATKNNVFISKPNDLVKIYGNLTDDWGHNWTSSELSNENFRARLKLVGMRVGSVASMDNIRIRINFTEVFGDAPQIDLISPPNASNVTTTYTLINWSLNDTEANEMDSFTFGTENIAYINQTLLTTNPGTAGGNFSYNWTAPITTPAHPGIWALFHLDNRSEFGEDDGNRFDFSGNGRDLATESGDPLANETGGYFGGAYEFDSNDGLNMPSGSGENETCINGCTFSVWAISSGTPPGGVMRAIERFSATNDDRFFTITVNVIEGTSFAIFSNGTAPSFCTAFGGQGNFPLNQWNHIVGSYNSTGNETKLYINGVLNDTTDCGNFELNQTSWNDPEIIQVGGGLGDGWNGSIDEIAIWNRTLNDTEVFDLFRLNDGETYFWNVNATDMNTSNVSDTWQFTIALPVPEDTCTYPGSGDWSVTCSDQCNITSNVDLLGNNLILRETGVFTLDANISNYNRIEIWDQCRVDINSPNRIF